MEVRDLLHYRQTQAEAPHLLAILLGREVGIENTLPCLRGDAGSLVGYQQLHPPPPTGHRRDAHRHAGGRGVDGVVHEVDQSPLEEHGVSRQRRAGSDVGGDADPVARGVYQSGFPDAAAEDG